MKKKKWVILFIVGFFLCFFTISVKGISSAGTIFVEVGVGNEHLLEEEGMVIVNNNVNWLSKGNYYVTYYDPDNDSYINKTVIVQAQSELEETTFNYQDFIHGELDEDYFFVDIIFINENDYFILANYLIPNPTYYDQEYGCVFYYQNNEYVWRYIYNIEFNNITQGHISENGIIVTFGVFDNTNSAATNILLLELDYNKKIIKQKKYYGNGLDETKKIYLNEQFIYLIISTNSNNGDYQFHVSKNNVILIMVLDYQTLNEQKKLMIGNSGDNIYLSGSFIENTLALLINVNGTGGNYPYNNKYQGQMIIRLNEHLEIINYFIIENNDPLRTLIVTPYAIYCFYLNYFDGLGYLKLTLDGKKVINQIVNMVGNGYLTQDFKYFVGDDGYIYCFLITKKDNKLFDGGLLIINNQSFEYVAGNYDQENFFKLVKAKNQIIKVTLENKKYSYCSVFIKQVDKYHSVNDNIEHDLYNVYLNGRLISPIIKKEIDYQTYGQQIAIEKYQSDNNSLIFKRAAYINLNSNIHNNEDYHLGVELVFNGIGYLNDLPISSGHKIFASGQYNLKIIGSNNEQTIINFTVKNLICTEKPSEIPKLIIENYDIAKTNNFDLNNKHIILTSTAQAKILSQEAVVIFGFGIAALIGIVLMFRRKR